MDAGNFGSEADFLASLVGQGALQDISLSGTELTITDGSTIDLAVIDTDTDTNLTEAEVDAFADNNGYLTAETQDLSLAGSDLSITGGSTIDLSTLTNFTDTNTQLSESEVDAFVANNGYLTAETQDISLAGSDLSITGGSTIDLSGIDTDTNLNEAEVDAFVSNNGFLTAEVDGDATNEIQDLDLTGSTLKITNNASATEIDLAPFMGTNTDEQDLQFSGGVITLTGDPDNTMIDLSGYDTDPANEIQTLSLADNNLSISGGNSIVIDPSNTNEINFSVNLNGTNLEITDGGGIKSADLASLNQDLPSVLVNGNDAGGATITGIGAPAQPTDAATKEYVDNHIRPLSEILALDPSAQGHPILDLADPVGDQDAATKKYVDDNTSAPQTLTEVLALGADANATAITNLADPINDQDAATKKYVDDNLPTPQTLSDVLAQGNDANSATIINLAAPINLQDAANKDYVDNHIRPLSEILALDPSAQGHLISDLSDPASAQDAATKAYVDLLESTVTTLTNQVNTLIAKVGILENESLTNLVNSGLSARELLDEGVTVEDLLNDGLTPQELLDAEITPLELLNAEPDVPVTPSDLYGLNYEGGLIFHVDDTDGSGLVAALTDQSSGVIWGTSLVGVSDEAIGQGAPNTAAIVATQGAGVYAAQIANELDLEGFTNWFLPSRDELVAMHSRLHKNGLGNFTSDDYWSSSEAPVLPDLFVSATSFASATSGSFSAAKSDLHKVRAARQFGSSVELLTEDGRTLQEMLDGGITPLQIYNNDNSSLPQLYGLTFDGNELSDNELFYGGISAAILIGGGQDLQDLLSDGINPRDLHAEDPANLPLMYGMSYDIYPSLDHADFVAIGFTARQLVDDNPATDIQTLVDATLFDALTDAYTAQELIDEATTMTLGEMSSASPGESLQDIFVALGGDDTMGQDLQEMLNGGISLTDMLTHFTDKQMLDGTDRTVSNIFDALGGILTGNPNTSNMQAMLDGGITLAEIISGLFPNPADDLNILQQETTSSLGDIYTALGGDPLTDLQEMFIHQITVNQMVNNVSPTYPNGLYDELVTLDDVRENITPAPLAIDFLDNGSQVTHQDLIDLNSPFTLKEIYDAEDELDGTAGDGSFDVSTLYGLTYNSGLVFYTVDDYLNVYLASTVDLTDSEWGCGGSGISGADGTAIGTGAQNTIDIYTGCTTADIAADRCRDLTDGSHTWFLPSENELIVMRLNLPSISTGIYWSSTEHGNGRSRTIDFSNGNIVNTLKGEVHKVRAATYIPGN